MVGIEPTIFRLGSERLIHWATRALIYMQYTLFEMIQIYCCIITTNEYARLPSSVGRAQGS